MPAVRKMGVKEKEVAPIQNDIELWPKFKKSFQAFLLQKYPVLWGMDEMCFIFPTSYVVEWASVQLPSLFPNKETD